MDTLFSRPLSAPEAKATIKNCGTHNFVALHCSLHEAHLKRFLVSVVSKINQDANPDAPVATVVMTREARACSMLPSTKYYDLFLLISIEMITCY